MTDIVEVLSDLDVPITNNDRIVAVEEILRLRLNLKKSIENTFQAMDVSYKAAELYFKEIK